MYIYVYIYTYIHICVCIHMYSHPMCALCAAILHTCVDAQDICTLYMYT